MSEGYEFSPALPVDENYRAPILVNGFPKSGTHLLLEFFRCLGTRCFELPIGVTNLRGGGWGPGFLKEVNVIDHLGMVEEGMYIGGHLAAQTEVMEWLNKKRWPVICAVRDLRDVAVSMAYHIEGVGGDDNLLFPEPYKSRFMELSTHEDRIRAVVSGHGGYPPMRVRWEQYAPWLQKDWVLVLDYETMRTNPLLAAKSILGYLEMRTERGTGDREQNAKIIVESMSMGSPTFRKGKIGEWKKEMGPSTQEFVHRRLGDWLDALGYDVPEGYGVPVIGESG